MSESDSIHKRGKALEDEFFHRVDEALLEKLRLDAEREEPKARLSAATGFQDPQLLDHLLDAGIGVDRLAALALVPTVWVAWADGEVTRDERAAVLAAAKKDGLNQDSVAFQLVQSWLDNQPAESLWDLWREYAVALAADLPAGTKQSLADEIVRQATVVAKASGGKLGFDTVSAREQAVLNIVAKTLQ
ncbi:hypothetical protein [Roseimaritima ulvae]|uniref:Tellurite resistance protein TerB n=1 Tax=Roseimaritima ulvae TaxID=980254 RepID=A0A5B9QSQ2_9BACT|nr:hypothetical protein [Roseimaritima ulvae]QEG42147.1 hypothetical protein UC8_41810 [Roseimaritima ulvae]